MFLNDESEYLMVHRARTIWNLLAVLAVYDHCGRSSVHLSFYSVKAMSNSWSNLSMHDFTSYTGLVILHEGNQGDCLHAPWPVPWCTWNALVGTYNCFLGCPLPRRKCLGALALSKKNPYRSAFLHAFIIFTNYNCKVGKHLTPLHFHVFCFVVVSFALCFV